MNTLSPTGSITILLATIGAATISSWLIYNAAMAFQAALPNLKRWIAKRQSNRALMRALRTARPMSASERQAMIEGAREAIAAFERAQMAVAQH